MRISWLIKSFLPVSFKSNIKSKLGVPSLHKSFTNLKKLGWRPRSVIDGGAYEGYWTKDFLKIYPTAKMLLVEAQHEKLSIIRKNCGLNVTIVNALLSSCDDKTLYFSLNETASSVVNSQLGSSVLQIKSRSLDSITHELNFVEIDLLKLDVQGHELEVLKGSSNLLISVEFVLLEMTLMPISEHEPIFLEVLNYMDACGFQMYDIPSLIYKPYDKALYQIDGLFVKKDSKYINKNW